jgi:hypothetical protein
MSGLLQNTDQHARDLELIDTLTGSVTACANIARKLDTLKLTTAGCLSGPLIFLVNGFFSMSQSYSTARGYLCQRNRIWSQNLSLFIESTQVRCQEIATELSTILEQYGEWDILAAVDSCRRLNVLSKSLQVLLVHHNLLFKVLDVVPVIARKPAEHEPPFSIVEPYHLPEWELEKFDCEGYEELQARLELAQKAARVMDKWSRDYADSLHPVREVLRQAKERSKELLKVQAAEVSPQTTDLEELPIVDDWSTTQSTIGIMTPTEDWSELGSDTTEIGHTPTITRHSLQLCGYVAASFLRLVEDLRETMIQSSSCMATADVESRHRLHKTYSELITQLLHGLDAPVPLQDHEPWPSSVQRVITVSSLFYCSQETRRFLDRNNAIERSFGHLPGSTPVETADIEVMHKAYAKLVETLHVHLAAPVPFRDDRSAPAPVPVPAPAPASVPIPAPEVPRPVIPEDQSEIHTNKVLEAIIDTMEPSPTEKDIMKLVFHWSTLEECNGFKRAEVMQFD